MHPGFRGLCVTTIVFVAASLLTEVEDPQAARAFIEATRPGAGDETEPMEGDPRARGGAVPADAED